jgi:hypothetical protein
MSTQPIIEEKSKPEKVLIQELPAKMAPAPQKK